MTPVSNNNDPQKQPTGNLEELFRQKFAEAELPPRADVWDRLDHELLLRENQGYRRRLLGYRRLAVAACAVVTLGAGGWLAQHVAAPGTASDIAAVDSAAADAAAARLGAAAAEQPLAGARRTASADRAATMKAGSVAGSTANSTAAGSAAAAANRGVAANSAAAANASVMSRIRATFGATEASATPERAGSSLASRALAAIKQTFGSPAAPATGGAPGNLNPGSLKPGGRSLPGPAGSFGTESIASTSSRDAGLETATTAAQPWTADALLPISSRLRRAAGPDSLKVALQTAPVLSADQLAAVEQEQEEKKDATPSRWRWRGGYSAQRFVPNVSSLAGSGVALRGISNSFNTPSSADQTKLQAGFAQRGQFGAAVPLGRKHWTLLTGAELTVISGNTGREVPQAYNTSLSPAADEKLQTGRYHLTTVGVPVQMRYEARKQGWGVYAAVGAAVNVLLRNRTAVGTMSSTDDASYRRVLATARGSAGVRFSPAGGQWQLNVGPEAEAGLTTLNANPTENWSQRTRPYAVGLSASVEFGGGKAELVP